MSQNINYGAFVPRQKIRSASDVQEQLVKQSPVLWWYARQIYYANFVLSGSKELYPQCLWPNIKGLEHYHLSVIAYTCYINILAAGHTVPQPWCFCLFVLHFITVSCEAVIEPPPQPLETAPCRDSHSSPRGF